jgi:hypothetical protein
MYTYDSTTRNTAASVTCNEHVVSEARNLSSTARGSKSGQLSRALSGSSKATPSKLPMHLNNITATSRKVAGSRPDKVNGFFPIYLILLAALGPGVYSASNRNEYQKQKNNVSGE